MTDREKYCAVLAGNLVSGGVVPPAGAIVVLCGEDAGPRVQVAASLYRQNPNIPVVLLGGRSEPPRIHGAIECRHMLMGEGVHFDRIRIETRSQNTREQAVALARIVEKEQWGRVLVVASAYHAVRAHLTIVQAFTEAGIAEKCHALMVPVNHTRWFDSPKGMTETRVELYAREMEKIEAYREKGHVATYAEGLDYLKFYEMGPSELVPRVGQVDP